MYRRAKIFQFATTLTHCQESPVASSKSNLERLLPPSETFEVQIGELYVLYTVSSLLRSQVACSLESAAESSYFA